MSKKDFSGGLNSLLGDQPETINIGRPKRGRPKTSTREITKSSQEGTKEGETRATFVVKEELLEKLKAVAYWERILIKEVVDKALQDYIDKYTKKNGSIKPVTKK